MAVNYAQALGLGGLNPTAIAQQTQSNAQAIEQNKMQMESQRKIQELAPLAAQGNADAVAELYGYAPGIAQGITQRYDQIAATQGAERANAIKRATGEFLVQYKQADPETRKQLTLAAEQNPLIDFDSEDYQTIESGNDMAVDFGIIESYGLDAYKQMFGGASAGGTPSQKDFEYYQDLLDRNPEAAKQYGMAKGYIETGREAAPTTEQRNWKEYQRLKKENPEEARQYGQAAGFISKEGRELSVAMQKRLSDATDEAVKLGASVVRYKDLADQVENANIPGGWKGQLGEMLKGITGSQDFRTELRKDYYAIRGGEVVNNLPPGAASDTDIQLALAGFPDDNASGAQIASFLRGLSKINEYQKKYNEFKVDYISENGTERGMLSEWKKQDVQAETPQRTLNKDEVFAKYGIN